MDSIDGGSELPQQLKPEYLPVFSEGIVRVLSRWTALQVAIENEWGGRLSRQKADTLASDIFSFFTKSKEPFFIDDLEDTIFEYLRDSLSMVVEDGSIEEVAEELMIMYEELLMGDLKSIEKLRKCVSASEAVSKSKAMNEDEDDGSSSDEASDMAVDEPRPPRLNLSSPVMPVNEPKPEAEAEDGWSVVSSKRNRAKKR